MTGGPSLDALVASTRELVPRLRERAHRTDELRTLPVETIEDLSAAGLFRLYQPRRYGGYELDWGAQVALSRLCAEACGSTAWIVTVLSTHAALVGRLRARAQDDVWRAEPTALVATASARTAGTARPVTDGFLLEGSWRFASGIDHARWVMVPAPVEGSAATGPASLRQCLVPAGDYEIVDDWHVSGLRGTGSKRVVVGEPVFVPEHRTLGFVELLASDPPGAAVNDGYVYRMELGPCFGTILLGPVLGAAEAALADYLEITRARVGAIRGDRIADALPVQLRVADSAAAISAAALLVERMIAVIHGRGTAGEPLTAGERAESMRDRAFVARWCTEAVFRLVRQMGASGLTDDNPVQRHFRDLTAMTAQFGLNWDRNGGTYGKWALGLPTGDPAIDADLPAGERPSGTRA